MKGALALVLAFAGAALAGEITVEPRYPSLGHAGGPENPYVLEENGRELGEFSRDPGGHSFSLDRDADDLDWDDLDDGDDDK